MNHTNRSSDISDELIADLRFRFCTGCTPFDLIEYLYRSWNGKGRWDFFVSDAIRLAFHVTFLQFPDRFESYYESPKRTSLIDTELLHEMVAYFPEWSSEMPPEAIADSWLKDVSATDIWTATDRFDPLASAETAKMWPALDESSRNYVRMNIVSGQVNYETALILARLMEAMQRRTQLVETIKYPNG